MSRTNADGPGLGHRTVRRIETVVVNPLVTWILRSRFHWLLSSRLLVLNYEGRVSGARVSTPVLYERDDRAIVVTTGRQEATWWKNFRREHPAILRLEGTTVETTGSVLTDPDRTASWVDELTHRSRLWSWLLGRFGSGEGERPDPEQLADRIAIVRFVPA